MKLKIYLATLLISVFVSVSFAQSINVIIKFKDEFKVRIRNKKITDFHKKIISNSLKTFLNNGSLERMHNSTSEHDLDMMHTTAEKNLGKKISNLNNYFIYEARDSNEYKKLNYLLSKCEAIEYFKISPKIFNPLPGNYQSSQFYLDNGLTGINASNFWTTFSNRGAGIKIVDIEWGVNLNHNDLPSITVLNTGTSNSTTNEHGTAVCGEIASLNNGWGTTGIASDCSYYFAPVGNIPNAITLGSNTINAGDFILIEQQMDGPNCNNCSSTNQLGMVPMEWDQACYAAIQTAVGNGRIVIEAAGNGSQNLDDAIYSTGNGGHYPFLSANNSGAILVGAGASQNGSSVERSRLSFSNYGSRLDLQGIGENIMTTGYGNYYTSGGADYDYINNFNGTSSASPIVAGAGILVQSKYKQTQGSVLSPAALRTALKNTGKAQQSGTYPISQHIGPLPDVVAAYNSLITTCTNHPSNDNCNGAILLSDNITCSYTSGTVDCATDDGFPTLPSCNGTSATQCGVFYHFIAQSNNVTIAVHPTNTCGTCLDAVVVLYSGSNCNSLNEIPNGCVDATDYGGSETLTATVTQGNEYWIRIYDWGAAQPPLGNGGFQICVTHTITPCTSPTATVNDASGTSSVTMTCNTLGGSGGNILYKWYSGTSCNGTVIGTNSTYNATSNGSYSCKAYISGYETTCYSCDDGYATLNAPCNSPTATVNDASGTSSVTMTCNTLGGSGGSILYKWYNGTSCTGTVIGANSTYNATSSGSYSCKAYISGYETTCYSCDDGYATLNAPCNSPTATVNDASGTNSVTMTCNTLGGSGGSVLYKWYNGTSCSGTVIGTNSTYNATSSGSYSCKAYISGYESTCYSCDDGYATLTTTCIPPNATVTDASGTSSVTMTCNASGGSGGSILYKWYSGSTCSGSVLGTNSYYNTNSSGFYSCKAYITGFESTCYVCSYGYATVNSPTTDITMSGSGTYTVCSANFYDGGGISNDYYDNQNSVVTIYPSTPGAKISVTFSSFNTQVHYNEYNNYSQIDDDILFVYNGNSISSPQIGALKGQAGYGTITSTANDGSLTFKFVSHKPYYTPNTGIRSGWIATVACNYVPSDITMIASGSFTTCGGNFYDAGGPSGDYMDDQNIIVPSGGTVVTLYPAIPGTKVSVTFNSFSTQVHYNELGNYSQMDDDVLYAYNGNSTSSPQIGALQGEAGYGTITSTANDGSLTFKFVSHSPYYPPNSGVRTGWIATIACDYTPTDITMIASGTFTTCGGNFYDSGGPSGDYMDNQKAIVPSGGTIVTLYPAIQGSKLSVTFSSFNSQTHYNEFGNYSQMDDDILYAYNGNSVSSPQIGALQGQAGYGTITSTAIDGSLTFKFVSHAPYYPPNGGERSGWVATIACDYIPTDVTMIASGAFRTCGGNFYDGGGPNGDYMDNQKTILPSGGSVVTLYPDVSGAKVSVNFSSFKTQSDYNEFGNYSQLRDDVLYAYNGNNTSAPQIGAYRDQAVIGTITSTASDGSLTFKFVSYAPYYPPSSGVREGWAATIVCLLTSINDTLGSNSPKISVYPNPSSGQLYISCTDLPIDKYRIFLADILGQTVDELNITSENKSLTSNFDLEKLTTGIYFLTIHSSFINRVFKVQKE